MQYQELLHGEPKHFATDQEAIWQLVLASQKSKGDWKLKQREACNFVFHPGTLSLLQSAGAAVFDVKTRPAFPLWHALRPLLPAIIIITDAHNLMASQLWDLSFSHWSFWCAFEAGKLFKTDHMSEEKKLAWE